MEKVIRETCIAGAVIDRCVKASFPHGGSRRPKSKPTSEAVRKNNDRLAAKQLTRLINANFYPGDLHATLTYAEVVGVEEAKHQLELWLRRMRREYKKQGKEFHYIAVTEYEHHRIHHHVVMSYIDLPVITSQWANGRVRCTALDRSRSYSALAEYLIKETQKTFREADNATKRRWKASRNLRRPVVKREWVSVRELWRDPKPLKGYQIDKNSVRYYQNPITGLEHLEYQMISIDPVPRLKTWRRGKIIKRQETYLRMEELRQKNIDAGEEEGTWEMC